MNSSKQNKDAAEMDEAQLVERMEFIMLAWADWPSLGCAAVANTAGLGQVSIGEYPDPSWVACVLDETRQQTSEGHRGKRLRP